MVAVVMSTLADAAPARTEEAERRRREADLTAEMAKVKAPERCWHPIGTFEGDGDPPRQREPLAGTAG